MGLLVELDKVKDESPKMPHLPLIETTNDPDVANLIDQIKRERGGQLLLLYKILLNSPAVTGGWLSLLTAVRQQTEIPGALRELIILRIACLNSAPYEFASHVPFALAEGVPQGWINALATGSVPADMPAREAASLQYTDEMTRTVVIKPETYSLVAKHFGAKQMLELTVTIAAYNMVSRVLVALEIEAEPH